MASYRYRAANPARELGASINDMRAQVLIFAKPMPGDDELARAAKLAGRTVIVDFCDDHFDRPLYMAMIGLADAITCPTEAMASRIAALSGPKRPLSVIPDAYEFPQAEPHCNGLNLLWFGNRTNLYSIRGRQFDNLRIVCNAPDCIPWSIETMTDELARADIVLLPKTADYKSPNRALEAIRQGCFVVAEPHPAISDLPIYIGDLKEGIEWTKKNDANKLIRRAQEYISSAYSPKTQADAWRRTLEPFLTSAAVASSGPAGLVSI